MRLLKFFGVFLATAVLIFGFVLGWNWNSFTIFLENRESLMEGSEWVPKSGSLRGLSEFMGENPANASVASVVIQNPDSSIFFEEHRRRVMGTTANLFILIGYAIEINNGNISGEELLDTEDIHRYKLTGIEESLHRETFRTARQRGWLINENITLNNALQLLAEYNDFSIADYLWWKLGPSYWDHLPSLLNLSETDMPLPYSGLYLAISPGIQDASFREIEEKWQHADPAEWRDLVIQTSSIYINQSTHRTEIQQYLKRNRLGNSFIEERDGLNLFPKTTAAEMVMLLGQMIRGELISEEVSRFVMDCMRWPVESQRGIERDFSDYGALYDNRMGLMNGIDFGTSAYTGHTTVQALFLDNLPIGFWFHASGGHMHQDFMQRLIYDPALIQQMKQVIK
ncbi:MAG: hypothetical protein EA359_02135 [Balneolaceae bacterium]|nr:MAG: hypothetical protein EA359_02135 [Balneolaceae bacterium]